MKRPGNNPKRRIAPAGLLSEAERAELIGKIKYVASGHHKRNPRDYGLERTNPRPTKSLCDIDESVSADEAKALVQRGIMAGMFSDYFLDGHPKFVWSVSTDDEVYEAKTDGSTAGVYHGYRLEEDDNMREQVRRVWKQRCRKTGT
jgi:hypothetical protein